MKTIRFFYAQLSVFLTVFSFCSASIAPNYTESQAVELLRFIHSRFTLQDGSFKDEFPEQIMSAMFISRDDKILEIGGNIGRNSCVISALLQDSRNLVVAESDPKIASVLIANRNRNHLFFHVEDSAISQVPLIQNGWVTIPYATVLPGYFQVKTISYGQLKEKYGIAFNVLVADCEGALYYIFQDDEALLEDVNLIIVENDYTQRSHYQDVCSKFIAHGFQLAYNKAGGWGPCTKEFYQVWKKL